MLNVDCPHCSRTVSSSFLMERREVLCPACGRTYPLKDLYITAGPYLLYRDVIMPRTQLCVDLLRRVHSECEVMEREGGSSLAHRETAKTMRVFASILREVLEGCREAPRAPGGRTELECSLDGRGFQARLMNISSTGLCLSQEGSPERFGRGRIINLVLRDRSLEAPLSLKGWVVWSTEKGITGMRFVGLNDESRAMLRALMTAKSEEEMEREGLGEGPEPAGPLRAPSPSG